MKRKSLRRALIGAVLVAEGVTNEKGETALAQSHVPQDAVLKLLDN